MYKINVARRLGVVNPRLVFWFRVEHDGSEDGAFEIARELEKAFPHANVSVSRWEHSGQTIAHFKWRES